MTQLLLSITSKWYEWPWTWRSVNIHQADRNFGLESADCSTLFIQP